MKTAIAANKVEQSQEHQTEVFGVDVSDSHIFTVLSDNLYRDKHLAVIRELACNGMDSHVAAGRPTKPLTIHRSKKHHAEITATSVIINPRRWPGQ